MSVLTLKLVLTNRKAGFVKKIPLATSKNDFLFDVRNKQLSLHLNYRATKEKIVN